MENVEPRKPCQEIKNSEKGQLYSYFPVYYYPSYIEPRFYTKLSQEYPLEKTSNWYFISINCQHHNFSIWAYKESLSELVLFFMKDSLSHTCDILCSWALSLLGLYARYNFTPSLVDVNFFHLFYQTGFSINIFCFFEFSLFVLRLIELFQFLSAIFDSFLLELILLLSLDS